MKKLFLFLIMILINQGVIANHLGTYGETFKIIEPDLLEQIETKLKKIMDNGQFEEYQVKIQNKVAKNVKRPPAVKGLIKTKSSKVFWYDPSLKVPYDLKDHLGRIFATSGTIINPLDTHKLRKTLLFIDGDDPAQVKWALNYPQPNKKILVNGFPFELSEKFKATFYFDQNGKLIEKFSITQVPACVQQNGKLLKVEEVVLGE